MAGLREALEVSKAKFQRRICVQFHGIASRSTALYLFGVIPLPEAARGGLRKAREISKAKVSRPISAQFQGIASLNTAPYLFA